MHSRSTRSALVAAAIAGVFVISACTGGDPKDPDATSAIDDSASAARVDASSTHVNNAYAGATMYVNDQWSARVLESADNESDVALADQMREVATTPTAVWMDRIGAIEGNVDGPGLRYHLDAALEQAQGDEQMIVTVVIYNLPGRDCFALSSNGELPASPEGLERYKSDYIAPIAQMLGEEQYRNLRVAAVIEPDSLPNLVTNASDPNCQKSDPFYREGVAYALDAFAPLDNVYSYVDAAHSGWLGWESNSEPTARLFAEVARSTEAGFGAIDGFVTNTANFTPLEEPYLPDPSFQVGGQPVKSGEFYEFNAQFDEADWTVDLYARLIAAGFPESIGMLIDTSRNGWGGDARPTAAESATTVDTFVALSKVDGRTHRGAWCNQAGAGLGRPPQALPAGFEASHLDAFVWIKPPGESDGASQEIPNDEGKGFDPMCDPAFTTERLKGNTTNALPDSPLSGKWFAAQFAQLVANAFPAVGEPVPAPREDPNANLPVGQPAATPSPSQATTPGSVSSASAGASSSPAPDASASGCSAHLTVANEWNTGFEARVTVTANAAIAGWDVLLTLPSGTSTNSLWNGEAIGTSGTFTVGDVGWNGALAAGGTGEFGFTGDGSAPADGALPCTAR